MARAVGAAGDAVNNTPAWLLPGSPGEDRAMTAIAKATSINPTSSAWPAARERRRPASSPRRRAGSSTNGRERVAGHRRDPDNPEASDPCSSDVAARYVAHASCAGVRHSCSCLESCSSTAGRTAPHRWSRRGVELRHAAPSAIRYGQIPNTAADASLGGPCDPCGSGDGCETRAERSPWVMAVEDSSDA